MLDYYTMDIWSSHVDVTAGLKIFFDTAVSHHDTLECGVVCGLFGVTLSSLL